MKVYVDKLPENCKKCIFNEWTEDYPAELYCRILSDPVSKETRDDNCPLIELKPKELIFDKRLDNLWVCGNFRIEYKKRSSKFITFYGINKIDESISLAEAILDCRIFVDKLFHEMIGG